MLGGKPGLNWWGWNEPDPEVGGGGIPGCAIPEEGGGGIPATVGGGWNLGTVGIRGGKAAVLVLDGGNPGGLIWGGKAVPGGGGYRGCCADGGNPTGWPGVGKGGKPWGGGCLCPGIFAWYCPGCGYDPDCCDEDQGCCWNWFCTGGRIVPVNFGGVPGSCPSEPTNDCCGGCGLPRFPWKAGDGVPEIK